VGREPVIQCKFDWIDEAAAKCIQAAGKFDLLVSFAYGAIFPAEFLKLFRLGGINVHPSLLPKYRGASPIQAAILAQDAETGITIQTLAERMDEGDILAQEKIPLDGTETGGSLSKLIAQKSALMLSSLIKNFESAVPRPQNEAEASYCQKTNHKSRRIDWRRSAGEIDAQIRAWSPDARCWTTNGGLELSILEGSPAWDKLGAILSAGLPEATAKPGSVLGVDKRLGILIQCGNGIYAARVLQYQTKKALDFRAFLNGAKNFIGTVLDGH
jgi:methionyl-tRNA formyltransferase